MNSKVTAGTIARTIALVLALINQLLTATGHPIIPISDDLINQLVSVSATIITSVIAWWKNNSFTKAALVGDEAMINYRMQELLDESIAEFTRKMSIDDKQ